VKKKLKGAAASAMLQVRAQMMSILYAK